MERQVGVRLGAARVVLDVAHPAVLYDVPLVAGHEVARVHGVRLEVHEVDVQLVAVVRPGAELEVARLGVEREVERVEQTRTPEYGLRHPQQPPVAGNNHKGVALFT